MLLTYKIKHNRDFSEELRKAKKVAEFCVKHWTQNQKPTPPPIQKNDSSPQSFSTPFSLSFSASSVSSPSASIPSSFLSSFSTFFSDFPHSPSGLLLKTNFSNFESASGSFPISESLSLRDVRHIGLKSTLSNQILKKYSRNKNLRATKSVKLVIPSREIRVNREERILFIPFLNLRLNYHFSSKFKKISQIEIDNTYVYVAVVFPEEKPESSVRYIGVDRNTKGHIVVVADPESGKIWKLGKMRYHTHKKYENIKKRLRDMGKHKQLKAVEQREKNIVKDLNHKISRKVVDIALYSGCGIKLENLKGIRKLDSKAGDKRKSKKNKSDDKKVNASIYKSQSKKANKKFVKNKGEIKKYLWSNEYSLNSWSFHQLQQFIEYKARLLGVEVVYVDPHATSKKCSRCGHTGTRHSKQFECPHCGHVDHADVNAAFNIALTPKGNGQFPVERDAGKGNSDIPQKVLARTLFNKRTASEETSPHFAWEVCQFLA